MAGLKKLHDKCYECSYKDKCNEKRMVACAMAELPQSNIENIVMSSAEPYGAFIARKETTIAINIGEDGTSLEEINRKIEESLYKKISCSFNRT